MATVEASVIDILLADATVAAQVGTRIYPVVIRQETATTAITYARQYAEREYSLAGPTGNATVEIRFTAWATTYPTARTIADAIRKAIDGEIGATDLQFMMLRDGQDVYDPDADLYGCTVDLTVMATEAA